MLSVLNLTTGSNGIIDKRFSARGTMGAKGTFLIVITSSSSSGAGGRFSSVATFCRIPVCFCDSGIKLKGTVNGRFHTSLTMASRGLTGTIVGGLRSGGARW